MLGVWEPMRDSDANNKGLNVSAKFYMAFSREVTEVHSMI